MRTFILISTCLILFSACKEETPDETIKDPVQIPELYLNTDRNAPILKEFLGFQDGILNPRDLDFNPFNKDLWIMNQGTNGSDFIIIQNVGEPNQSIIKRKDSHSSHFVNNGSALAFSDINTFATSPEIKNTVSDTSSTFMGPALWSGDLNVFANIYQTNWQQGQPLGSHYDMLHQSPYAMGIAHRDKNSFYVLDGWNKNLCLYNFTNDHGPGAEYHADGIIYRFIDVKFERVKNIPSHIIVDGETEIVYFCDTRNGQVISADPSSSYFKNTLIAPNEQLTDYQARTESNSKVLVRDLLKPSGIALNDSRLFVGDFETGKIHVFDKKDGTQLAVLNTGSKGITGLVIGPQGALWFVNYYSNKLYKVIPQ